MAALIQAVVVKLHKLQWQNMSFRIYRRRVLDENRWRASRYGLEGKLIDFGREAECPTGELMEELLQFVSSEIDELGSKREFEHVQKILREGTGADRQLEVWARTRDMREVVDQLVAETYEGLTLTEA